MAQWWLKNWKFDRGLKIYSATYQMKVNFYQEFKYMEQERTRGDIKVMQPFKTMKKCYFN